VFRPSAPSSRSTSVIDDHLLIGDPVVYQHPLAYLLGLEGIALLRAFSGAYDRDFTLSRLDEIRMLLDSGDLGGGFEIRPITTREAYAGWAASYDEAANQLLDLEQPVVREILDGLSAGVALDAACGTGRHTAYLASLGHEVIGVDSSPEMLEVARTKVPTGTFHEADLLDLPLDDDSVDLVVCAIALTHVPDLAQALREFVRVLKPNGHLVISDSRGVTGDIGLPVVKVARDGSFGYMPTYARLASDYLAAALPLGLEVRRCAEPRRPSPLIADESTDVHDDAPSPEHVLGDPPNIWALHPFAAAATNAAYRGSPAVIVWQFQLGTPR
jgi:ubiquinone/menaquinone biosynthesis C-methylase UbiE